MHLTQPADRVADGIGEQLAVAGNMSGVISAVRTEVQAAAAVVRGRPGGPCAVVGIIRAVQTAWAAWMIANFIKVNDVVTAFPITSTVVENSIIYILPQKATSPNCSCISP